MLQYIEKYWDALIMMLAEMAPYLLLGFFFAGLLRAFVPKSIYRKHLYKCGAAPRRCFTRSMHQFSHRYAADGSRFHSSNLLTHGTSLRHRASHSSTLHLNVRRMARKQVC